MFSTGGKARERNANPVRSRSQQLVWKGEENTHGVECVCLINEELQCQ